MCLNGGLKAFFFFFNTVTILRALTLDTLVLEVVYEGTRAGDEVVGFGPTIFGAQRAHFLLDIVLARPVGGNKGGGGDELIFLLLVCTGVGGNVLWTDGGERLHYYSSVCVSHLGALVMKV